MPENNCNQGFESGFFIMVVELIKDVIFTLTDSIPQYVSFMTMQLESMVLHETGTAVALFAPVRSSEVFVRGYP